MRISSSHLAALLVLAAVAAPLHAAEKQVKIDPFKDNILIDGDMHFAPVTEKDNDKPRKVFMQTDRYWVLTRGTDPKTRQEIKGENLPFDTDVKFVGDASVRMDGDGGRVVFSKVGWADTSEYMRHGWAYTASVRLKLKDVKGKVYVKVGYSWGNVQSKDFTGTMDWTPVTLDFQCDPGTNLFQGIDVVLEGSGAVWVNDLQLHMKNPDAYKWWHDWNSYPATAKVSEIMGADAKAGVLTTRPAADELDQYGGIKSVKGSRGATGFFYVEKIGGKWWLITPEGHGFYKVAMFSPSPGYDGDVRKQLGDTWATQTYMRLTSWGFNSHEWGGSLMDVLQARYGRAPKELQGKHLTHTMNLRYELCTDRDRNGGVVVPMVSWGWQSFPDVFSDEFAKAVESFSDQSRKEAYIRFTPDDPWLIGYLLADEPAWYGPGVWYGSLTDGFQNLPKDAAGKKRWTAFVQEKYSSIEKLNAAWESNFKSWDEFIDCKDMPRNKASVQDRRDFMGVIADRWYGLIVQQVRKYDKNHLVLGGNTTRLYPTVLAAEAKSVDTLCASMYGFSGCYRPASDVPHWLDDQIVAWTGKPIMVGYCCTAGDAGGINDWSMSVPDTPHRGQDYVAYMRQMASHPNVVGVFWWTWSSWSEPSGEGYSKNWGVVDSCNRAYLDLLPYLQEANLNVYRYRTGRAPEKIEAPTTWWPAPGMMMLDPSVRFQITPLPYPVDKYEIEITGPDGKAAVVKAKLDKGAVVASRKLAPGKWQWRSRSVKAKQTSDWSLPFEFEVASPQEAEMLAANNKSIADGAIWKMDVIQNDKQNVQVKFTPNADGQGGKVPMLIEVPKGQSVKRIDLTCKLPKPIVLRKGVSYSLRVNMLADTEAAANPLVTMVFKYGYRVTSEYAPIDEGWSAQHELTGGKITPVRTSVRLPRDMTLEGLGMQLEAACGKIQIVSVQVVPETRYEVPFTILCDYPAIIKEYSETAKK